MQSYGGGCSHVPVPSNAKWRAQEHTQSNAVTSHMEDVPMYQYLLMRISKTKPVPSEVKSRGQAYSQV
jgi:hypothetical protein